MSSKTINELQKNTFNFTKKKKKGNKWFLRRVEEIRFNNNNNNNNNIFGRFNNQRVISSLIIG